MKKEIEMKRDMGSIINNNVSIKLEDVESQDDGADPNIARVPLTAKEISMDNDAIPAHPEPRPATSQRYPDGPSANNPDDNQIK